MPTSKTMNQVAQDYGYEMAFLKSDPELYSVFTKAVNGKWDAVRFVAAVRATKWYKNHSETWRQNQQLRYSDPTTWEQGVRAQRAAAKALAASLGLSLTTAQINKVGEDAYMMGYSNDQIQATLVGLGKGALTNVGKAGETENALRLTAYRNGVNVTDTYIKGWVSKIQAGTAQISDAQQAIRETYAKGIAPGFEKELMAGQDLYDLASPYMQTMAKTLELNPSDIDLFDPTIRSALASSTGKDGQAGSVPLWQFETNLRKDKRWLQTTTARDQVDSATRSLAQMFGVGV